MRNLFILYCFGLIGAAINIALDTYVTGTLAAIALTLSYCFLEGK